MDKEPSNMKKIGFWLHEKKCKKFDVAEFIEECRKLKLEVVKLDLETSIEEQGPFDIILHKMTAIYAQALEGNMEARLQAERFENGVEEVWNVPVVDPLPGVHTLLHRPATYALLQAITQHIDGVLTPPYVELSDTDIVTKRNLLVKAGVTFPIVCKPVFGCGGTAAHELAVVLSERRLQEWHGPCVAQSFVPHGAVLYKLYVLGSDWYLDVRPSLKNFKATDAPTVHFNSAKVSKAGSCSTLTQLDQSDLHTAVHEPKSAVLQQIVDVVRNNLKMDLLGIDVVIDSNTGHYAIIDVNPFPSYDSIADLMPCLARLLRQKVDDVSTSSLFSAPKGRSSIGDLLPPLERTATGELVTRRVLESTGDVMELLYNRRLLARENGTRCVNDKGEESRLSQQNGICNSKCVTSSATMEATSDMIAQTNKGDTGLKQLR
ncbi:Inositol-tetrakisphosphate 1-kinase [Trinorchestia longiramus]|nr:Inositol-tetrakisphosphate 1-kinase [Trinorchestia longiramus]